MDELRTEAAFDAEASAEERARVAAGDPTLWPVGPIELVPPDPSWPARFEAEAARLREALGPVAVRVEHFGSTAIPGIAAKPFIDIQLIVASFEPFEAYASPLRRLGYVYRPDDEPAHRFFKRGEHGIRLVQIHVVEEGSWWGRKDLEFRDAIRADPEAARRYEQLKRELAARFPHDVDAYAEAKTEFVRSALRAAKGRSGR
jgi:GrpB-like predicted nucleotidyltransferase (UPF0157 family)